MSQRRPNWNLFIGITLLGLTAWSAISSAAEEPSANCAAKVKEQLEETAKRTGVEPSKSFERGLTEKCSERQVGVQLEELFGKRKDLRGTLHEEQCRVSVKFARENSFEKSDRSDEELVKVCMVLPAEHAASCGFPPENADYYYVVENDLCVKKESSQIADRRSYVAKAEGQLKKGEANDADSTDPFSGSAQ